MVTRDFLCRLAMAVAVPTFLAAAPVTTPTPAPTPSLALLSGDPSRLSSAAQTDRSAILSVITAEEWAGVPANATFASDVTCTDPTQLAQKCFDAFNLNPNAYHRIRLQNSSNWVNTANGFAAGGVRPAFGPNGGITIEPDAGHNPIMTGQWQPEGRRIQFKGITFAYCNSQGGAAGCVEWARYSFSKAATDTHFIFKFKNCNFGAYWHPTLSDVSNWAQWSSALIGGFGEQVIVEDCTFRRASYQVKSFAHRITVSRRNTMIECAQVAHFVHELSGDTDNYKGLFADDNAYMWITQNSNRGAPDAVSVIGTPHDDMVQHSRLTVAQGGSPAPLGNGPYPPGNMRAVIENNVCNADISSAQSGTGIIPGVNLYIDSDRNDANPNPNANQKVVIFNNIVAGAGFLAQVGNTTNYIECNTSISATQMPSNADQSTYTPAMNTIITFGGGSASCLNNICRSIAATNGGTVTTTGSILLGDQSTTPVGSRPQDKLVGPFTLSNDKWCFALSNGNELALTDYNAVFIAAMTPLGGVTAGAH